MSNARRPALKEKTAALTPNEAADLAADASYLINKGGDAQSAVQRVVQGWEQSTGRKLPLRDYQKIQAYIPTYGKRSPNSKIRQQLRQFLENQNKTLRPHDYREVNPEEAREVARHYEALPRNVDENDPRFQALRKSYAVFRLWIRRQYKQLLGGIKVEPWPGKENNPYPNSKAMREDVRNGHLWVFTGGTQTESHPFLSPAENIMFRAVHDYVTHSAEGYELGPRGEYNAWLHHASTLPEEAYPALENETVGQNMWSNYGPHMQENPQLPLADRPFVLYPPVVPMQVRPRLSRRARLARRLVERTNMRLKPAIEL